METMVGSIYEEHCLSRRFPADDSQGSLAGNKVGLPIIREIIDQPDYGSFLKKLRAGPIMTIPQWIGGDFNQLTGPNDPLFLLHLAYVHVYLGTYLWSSQDMLMV